MALRLALTLKTDSRPMTVLIVDPDSQEAERLAAGLAAEGFKCEWTEDGAEALRRAPSLGALVMELALPGRSGLDIIRSLREHHLFVPVIFHAAHCGPEERVRGLEAGADDFLSKPCTVAELAARLRAVLRRRQPALRLARIRVADLLWEPRLRRVSRSGRRIDLTPKEYALVALLLEHRGEVVSRELIAQALWCQSPGHAEIRSTNAMDVQIRRLRAKLDGPFATPLLHTLRGLGLVIEARESVSQKRPPGGSSRHET
jgi:two-component system copper resistance phosphate regulon response regulator CusR